MSPSTSYPSMAAAAAAALLVLSAAASAQFQIVSSQDPSIALQPPPLHQGQFATFSAPGPALHAAQPAFLQPPPLMLQPLQPLPVARQLQQPQQPQLAHHSVVRNAEEESRLPEELRNNFYKNPRIAESLAKESWFTPGEEHVLEREAEKIPRDQIFKLLKNAGLARRR